MSNLPAPEINIPAVLQDAAKSISGQLPPDMKLCLVAFAEFAPEHPLMACNAPPPVLLAALRQMILDIEMRPANRAERRAEQSKDEAEPVSSRNKIIANGWAWFGETFIPPTAPVVQRVEMRKAFYAGAQYLFSTFQELATGDPVFDQGLVEGLREELDAFQAMQEEARKRR